MTNHYGYRVTWSIQSAPFPISRPYAGHDFEFAESHWRKLCLNPEVTRATLYELGHLTSDRKVMYDYSAAVVPS